MAVPQVVSGVGAGAKRVDKNNVERVQKIQRNAQIQQASGGAYGDRMRNESSVQDAPITPTASGVSANVAMPPAPRAGGLNGPNTDIFAPNNPNDVFTNGAGGNTAGTGPDALNARFNTHDAGYVLLAAMYQTNPTPEIAAMLEAYNEEGIF
jgi:hypothetical protein